MLYGDAPAPELLACAEIAEDAGLAGVWVGDSQVLWREAYVLLGALAARTRRVRLGIGVTNPVTRHPSVTASALRSLAELAGSRVVLGLGSGDSSVRLVGERPVSLRGLERAVARLRALWSDTAQGLRYGAGLGAPPILVGASGPRMLELAGRVGDGCLLTVGRLPEQLDAARSIIAEGRQAAAGQGPFELVLWLPLAVDDDPARARAAARPYVARSLLHPTPAPLRGLAQEVAERLRAGYSYERHLAQDAVHVALVPDQLVDGWAIAGTPSDCAATLRELADQGFPRIALVPMGRPKAAVVRRLARDVLPRIPGRPLAGR